jgi:hypothetical protein
MQVVRDWMPGIDPWPGRAMHITVVPYWLARCGNFLVFTEPGLCGARCEHGGGEHYGRGSTWRVNTTGQSNYRSDFSWTKICAIRK